MLMNLYEVIAVAKEERRFSAPSYLHTQIPNTVRSNDFRNNYDSLGATEARRGQICVHESVSIK